MHGSGNIKPAESISPILVDVSSPDMSGDGEDTIYYQLNLLPLVYTMPGLTLQE